MPACAAAGSTRVIESIENKILHRPECRIAGGREPGREKFPFHRRRVVQWLYCLLVLCAFSVTQNGLADGESGVEPPLWRDPAQPLDVRVQDLVSRMTLREKVRQICNHAPAIPRLGLPGYDYWNESLHGVARNGVATVFPQAIGMAAAWDPALLHETGDVIATEGPRQEPCLHGSASRRQHQLHGPDCSGRLILISTGTRGGVAARKPTARIRSSRPGWRWRSSRDCRARTRNTSRQ